MFGAGTGSRKRWPAWRIGVAGLLGLAVAAALLLASLGGGTRSVRFTAPGGRYAVTLLSDTAFGQVETLRVTADPGTAQAQTIFERPGDTPLRFLGWRDGTRAELEFPPQTGDAAYRLLLSCQGARCTLDRLP